VHLTSYQVPGYGYEEIQLSRAQQQLGHDLTIVASNYLHPPGIFYGVLRERFPERQVPPGEEQVDGVTVLRLRAVEVERRVWLRGMEECLRGLRPDIVHAHNLMQFHSIRAALMRATRRGRFGLVIDDHMLFSVMRVDRLGRLIYSAYRYLLGPIIASNVDRFCAATEESRRYLQRECGVRSDIPIMPLGVDTERFQPSPEQRQVWRRRLGLDEADVAVLYTGKVIASKRLEDLVDAVLQLRREKTPVRLVIAGDADPDYRQSLLSITRTSGDEGALFVRPSMPHDELAGLYAAADIAVWPGTESMAIFEALATALPVIVSDRSAYAALVLGGAGRTFKAGDPGSLAGSLREFLPPERRRSAGRKGRELTETEYSWRRSAERYLSLYMEILEGRAIK
jgi:glycosyltransferase involved in cell wall biosynthesis